MKAALSSGVILASMILAPMLWSCPCRAGDRVDGVAPPGELSDDVLQERGFIPLISADSLSAWDVQPWHEGHWVLKNGVIDYDGKSAHRRSQRNSLWTKEKFGDVMCYAEWRLPAEPKMKPHPIVLFNADFLLDEAGRRITRARLDAGDSGVLLRGVLKCQANIWSQELGSGEINGYRTDQKMPPEVRRASIPIRKADRPLGEWNVFFIVLIDDQMTVELNGQRVIDAVPLPELPRSGAIGLQHHGDPVRFRRIWVKPVNEEVKGHD